MRPLGAVSQWSFLAILWSTASGGSSWLGKQDDAGSWWARLAEKEIQHVARWQVRLCAS